MTAAPSAGLTRLNTADAEHALALLREVCAAGAWLSALLAGRPYAGPGELYAASDAATAALDDAGLDEAMAGHPPIGRRSPGDATSAREQRGMAAADDELRQRVRELTLAYQERFGHVFLICASGLTARQLNDALVERLTRTPRQERATARTELGRINRLRLTRLAEGPDASEGPVASEGPDASEGAAR